MRAIARSPLDEVVCISHRARERIALAHTASVSVPSTRATGPAWQGVGYQDRSRLSTCILYATGVNACAPRPRWRPSAARKAIDGEHAHRGARPCTPSMGSPPALPRGESRAVGASRGLRRNTTVDGHWVVDARHHAKAPRWDLNVQCSGTRPSATTRYARPIMQGKCQVATLRGHLPHTSHSSAWVTAKPISELFVRAQRPGSAQLLIRAERTRRMVRPWAAVGLHRHPTPGRHTSH